MIVAELLRRGVEADVRENTLVVLVLGLVGIYLAADLADKTMGLDGVLYAAIANFAAAGAGSFWFPTHFEATGASFHDHPPLGLWLLSQWFGVFGDSSWVEAAFNALVTLGVALFVVAIWRRVAHYHGAWWPLVILFLMPVSTYALKNNSLEGLLALVALAGVWLAWLGRANLWLNTLVGFFCLVGFLIKGPIALFPLAVPGIFALVLDRRFGRALGASCIALGSFAGLVAALFLVEGAQESLRHYFDAQVIASLAGERAVEHGRGYQLGQLSLNLLIGAVLILMMRRRDHPVQLSREFWAFVAVGLVASLPILLSPRQYKHYLLACLPYFAICFALLIKPRIYRGKAYMAGSIAILVIVSATLRVAINIGMPGKDGQELADAATIAGAIAPAKQVLFCQPYLQRRAYLARYHGVRSSWVDFTQASEPPQSLNEVGVLVCDPGRGASRFPLEVSLTDNFSLFRQLQ